MQRLANKSRTPSGGWRYFDEDTGTLVTGAHWGHLVQSVYNHRTANELPCDPSLVDDIESYMCAECSDSCESVSPPATAYIGIADVITLTRTLAESFLKGNPRVDTLEANRRAKICSGCAANVEAGGCRPCHSKSMEAILLKFSGPKKTDSDQNLKSCLHCGCFNKVQVWFPLDILQKNQRAKVKKALPDNCWKK